MKLIERLKSPVVITALAALIIFVVRKWAGLDIPGWDEFIDLLLGCLMAFGVFNNPTDKKNF
jgi:uncharacterized membrane protein